MAWKLSKFRKGDIVEVRSKDEILATLDEHGCLENLPFMPEMLQFCGKRYRVGAVAHKTCDTSHGTWRNRRLRASVHLDGLRCDGAAHDGCQAACNLYWKDAWLKPVHCQTKNISLKVRNSQGCTEAQLFASTKTNGDSVDDGPYYSCQATKIFDASEPFGWLDLRQYINDVKTGNHSIGRVVRVVWLAALRWTLTKTPVCYRMVKSFRDQMHLKLSGRPTPSLNGKFKRGERTPTGRLDLKPGELVRIKSQAEIEQTVDETGRNRGLSFDKDEMAPYCGQIARVRDRISKIIHERSGQMIFMKEPCIMLDGVVCNSEYASCRLNCPKAVFCWWRELWLERVNPPGAPLHEKNDCAIHAENTKSNA